MKIPFAPFSLANGLIVAPHGITDLFHAFEYNNMLPLSQIYTSAFSLIPISDTLMNYDNHFRLLDCVFILSAIIHFRHDMPKISRNTNHIRQEWMSFLLIMLSPVVGMNIFSLYMIFHHVPRHYKKCWPLVQKYKKYMIVSICLLSIPGYYMIDNFESLSHLEYSFMESIIVAHIVYNEIYIDNQANDEINDTL